MLKHWFCTLLSFFFLLIAFPLLGFKPTICKINKNTAFPKKEKSSEAYLRVSQARFLWPWTICKVPVVTFQCHIKIGFPSPRKVQPVMSVTAGGKATIICQLCFLFKESISPGWHIAGEKKDTYKSLFSFSIIFGAMDPMTSQ